MNTRKESALNQALDAAVDEILNTPPVAPPSPSVSSLCKAAGIGASTFYRLFVDADDFRRAAAVWHLETAYDPGREAVVETFDAETNRSEAMPERPDEEESHEPPPLATEEEFTALVLAASQSFGDSSSATDIAEAHYLPWLEIPEIRQAIAGSFVSSGAGYGGLYEEFLVWVGRDTLPTSKLDDLTRRIMAVTVGSVMTPMHCKWETLVANDVSVMNYCHVEIADAMTIPNVDE